MTQENEDRYRYGIFLRPQPAVGANALKLMTIAQYQFGMPAAIAYPPHITLVGSIALSDQHDQTPSDRTPTAREQTLLSAVSGALKDAHAFRAVMTQFSLSEGNYLAYRFSDEEGASSFPTLMGSVLDAVTPLRCFHGNDLTVEHRKKDSPANFRPHLTVLSHDGAKQPDVTAEAYTFMRGLALPTPQHMLIDTVTAFRFFSKDWEGEYWHTMKWTILKSWTLPIGAE